MYTDEDLDAAVAAGVMPPEAATALRARATQSMPNAGVDEERLRLVSSFNDIFVAVASTLLLVATGSIGAQLNAWAGAIGVCGVAWVLAEFFVRKRRMALPAIMLLAAWVGGASFASFTLVSGNMAAASFVAAVAGGLYWLRFKAPIAVPAVFSALITGLISALVMVVPSVEVWVPLMIFLAGLATFVFALRWDAKDLMRSDYRSDVAFWLHLLAAPLLVQPVFHGLSMLSGHAGALQSLLIAVLYGFIALVSLAINRRSLMVAALGYVLFAFADLLNQSGVVGLSFAFTALIVGLALLILSAYWHQSRQFVMGLLPPAVRACLAPS
jgi:hypothetical protein